MLSLHFLHKFVVIKETYLFWRIIFPLVHVIVGNQQLTEHTAAVEPLPDVVEPLVSVHLAAVVQAAYFLAVVVRNKELSAYTRKCIPEPFVVGSCETYVFVIALGRVIRRVAIEKAHLAVLCGDELLKVSVFDYDSLQTARSLFYQREIAPHGVGSAAEAVTAACVAVPDKLIELRGALYIADLGFLDDYMLDTVEVLPAVQHEPEPFDKLRAFVTDAGVQI